MLNFFRSLLPSVRRDEDGASAVEYGLLVAGIAALIVAVVFFLGGTVTDAFQETCDTISGEGNAANTQAGDCA
jgi:pilus assembly protein Flp/PilA